MTFLTDDISKPSSTRDFSGCSAAEQGSRRSIPNIFNTKSIVEPGPLLVQVLLVIDISRSTYSIKEALKDAPLSLSRHPEESNRPNSESIVRLQELAGDDGDAEAKKTKDVLKPGINSIHKLLLQDAKGNTFYAVEQKRMDFINMCMPLGSKMVLTNVFFQHGVAILDTGTAYYLGGEIKTLNERSKEALLNYLDKLNQN